MCIKVPESNLHLGCPQKNPDKLFDTLWRLLNDMLFDQVLSKSISGTAKMQESEHTRSNFDGLLVVVGNIILEPFPIGIILLLTCLIGHYSPRHTSITKQTGS